MLVCTQCGFENPNSNNFCQECGGSLMHNNCPACGSLVPFNVLDCQDCGAEAGVVWLAVTQQLASAADALDSGVAASANSQLLLYLDGQQRYQCLDSFIPAPRLQRLRVLDCQPLQLSPLEALGEVELEQLMAAAQPGAVVGIEEPAATGTWPMPAIALPYLALRNQFFQVFPAIHDAWQCQDQAVVLLEPRDHLGAIAEFWASQTTNSPLALVNDLTDFVELWAALTPWHCRQSLLVPGNLCIDADEVLCMQCLYLDAEADSAPTLAALGQLWQQLLAPCQLPAAITLLIVDVATGKLATVDATLLRLDAIAQEAMTPASAILPEFSSVQAHIASQSVMSSSPSLEPSPELLRASTQPLSATSTADLPAPNLGVAAAMGTPAPMATLDTKLDTTPDTTPDDTAVDPAPGASIPSAELALLMDDDEGDSESDEMPTVVLPMQLFSLEDVGRTDTGRQRDHNEDFYGIDVKLSKQEGPKGITLGVRNLYVLCDGMGGHAGGEVASMMAVNTLRQYFQDLWQGQSPEAAAKLPDADTMMAAVQLANKAIYDENQKDERSGSGRMGTTLVMMLVQDTSVAIAHVGDSRLYRYTRKRGLEQITIDHEVGQREIQRGVEADIAYARPDAYQLTQALGPRDEFFIKPDVQYLEINEDSLFLLCSDGLSDNDLLEVHWKSHVEPLLSSQTNLDHGISKLLDLANEYNGHDNITAIAVRAKVRPNLAHLR